MRVVDPFINLDTEDVRGLWYVQVSSRCDVLGCVVRLGEDSFRLAYRFRHYRDNKVHDSTDERNYYEGKVTGTEVEVLAKFHIVLHELALALGGQIYEALRGDRSMEALAQEFSAWPCVHMKKVKGGELE